VNQYQIAIIGLLVMEAITLWLLWLTHRDHQFWQEMWTRDTAANLSDRCELLYYKRIASRRDPKTGRFIKKDKI
jgi:hypothetical protein